jgi:26S proteasome regulatory subunit N3
MSGDKPPTNGTDPVENGINGTEDVEMEEESSKSSSRTKSGRDKDGDEEMTVVVPPPKATKLSSAPQKDDEGDIAMNGTAEVEVKETSEPIEDPKSKATTGMLDDNSLPNLPHTFEQVKLTKRFFKDIKNNFALLERAVTQFDPRFTLRVLRSISSIRKHITADVLAQVITETYHNSTPVAAQLLDTLRTEDSFPAHLVEEWHKAHKPSIAPKEVLPEVDVYLSILCQIRLYDKKEISLGTEFSTALIEHLRSLNRRTLDSLAARAYFYYSLFYEETAPLPPSPSAAVISIRKSLLDALRTATLRKDQDVQATVTTLLLRNYLSTSHITQADLLISHTKFPAAASNNQVARYLYYLGRIRAVQLSYTEAHEHLIGATRKSPTSYKASGFYQASTKLLVVVELLMGDIPDRAIFRQPSLERALQPYLQLVQAVGAGDVDGFHKLTQRYNSTFREDDTYTLILRLRQNVIKTGIRMMSLSYARISLRDMCLRLGLDSEESAEYIVAKAIRDGVIEATLDHEGGYMKSKDVGDVYATREPGDAFHARIQACLTLHDESVTVSIKS